jgi:lactoylglutathione lyase
MSVAGGVPTVRIDHVALWVEDLERMRAFYVERLGGRGSPPYHNERTGFRSFFISFADGPRVELMKDGTAAPQPAEATAAGYAHLALGVGSRANVDTLVCELTAAGVTVVGPARTTGDGYYEAVILNPEGNRIEITSG